jgi:putative ABC transport system permease protein
MSVLNRKLRRDLFAAKGMLAAVIGIIVVGISCFVAMASVYLNLDQARRDYYARCRMADFSVELKKMPLAEVDRVENVRGVTEIRPRIVFSVVVDLPDVERPVSAQVLSLPDSPRSVINGIVLRRGSYFTERRREEVIVNDAFARAHGIKPGDRIRVILNNAQQELVVVGTAISSEFVYLIAPGGIIPDPKAYGVFYLKQSYAEDVFDFKGACNQIVGRLAPEVRDRPEEVLSEIETRLDDFGVMTTTPRSRQPSHWFLSAELTGLRVSVVVLPTIFLVVAALILNVLMTRLAEQQRTIVGTLKALGYGNAQLFAHYAKFGGTVGLIGGVLGAVAGFLMAGGMMSIYREFYEFPQLVNRPQPGMIGLGVGMGVVSAILGTIRGTYLVLKLAPAEAMRPTPPKRGRRILLERIRPLWRLLGFRWHVVLRGIFRQRMRTAVTVGCAAVGASLLLMTFHMRDAMLELVRFQFDAMLRSDFDLALGDERSYDALLAARNLPGVDYAEPVLTVGGTFHNGHFRKQGGITGIRRDARLTGLFDTAGNPVEIPKVGVVLTKKLAEILHVRAGDVLTFVPIQGRRDRIPVPVAAVVDSYLGTAAYAEFDYLNGLVGEERSVNMLQVTLKPGREETRAFYRELKQLPTLQGVSAIRDQKQKLVDVLIKQMMISIVMVIVFAGMIFFGSILNASLISLAERQSEIAVLRAMGYTAREVGGLFLRENLCLNVTGLAVGLPLGYGLCLLVDRLYNTELFRIPFIIQPASWLWTVALGVLFAILAHVPVQRAINRAEWQQALNVKE